MSHGSCVKPLRKEIFKQLCFIFFRNLSLKTVAIKHTKQIPKFKKTQINLLLNFSFWLRS